MDYKKFAMAGILLVIVGYSIYLYTMYKGTAH